MRNLHFKMRIAILFVLALTAINCLAASQWVEVKSTNVGNQDNVLSAIAANNGHDIWAVGQYAPESNPNITQTLVQHYDGTTWSVVSSPNIGTLANALFSVTAKGGLAWAVGYYMDSSYNPHSLIEAWDGTQWSVMNSPRAGDADQLFGVSAISPKDIWAVGFQRTNGQFYTVAEHFDGTKWSLVSTPNPGSTNNQLFSVTAVSADGVWAVGGQTGDQGADSALIEHWDGKSWSVIKPHADGNYSLALYWASGISDDDIIAVGDAQDNVHAPQNLAVLGRKGSFSLLNPVNVGTADNHLYGVYAYSRNVAFVVGDSLDPTTGNFNTLVEVEGPIGFTPETTPNPSVGGNNQLGGVVAVSATEAWAVGTYDGKNNARSLILHRMQ